ncbi:MAG TPA: autotransporter-associated beta strand repeat-containing protein [Chthoniobacterales bacterium]|jgi:autotransporter-associated beta strand protein
MTKTISALTLTSLLFLTSQLVLAGSATWSAAPTTGNWNTAANWTPNTIPNGPTDVASFAQSAISTVSISQNTQVDSIVFEPGASAFTIGPSFNTLTISGAGVINNSGVEQNFFLPGGPNTINFINSATAGDATYTQAAGGSSSLVFFDHTTNAGSAVFINQGDAGPGSVFFNNSSSAADGTFYNQAGISNGGATIFEDEADAGNATLVCDGGSDGKPIQGFTRFSENSSAANASLVANGASVSNFTFGVISFEDHSTAANATITVNGGTVTGAPGARVYFSDFTGRAAAANSTLIATAGTNGGLPGQIFLSTDSTGDKARIELLKGKLNITNHNPPGVTVGSIEGNGTVLLGANNLTVGTNNLSTNFSGTLKDGDSGGSLTKIGTGKFTLSGPSTYSGGTVVNAGVLLVNNATGSGLGTGPVQTATGSIGGRGIIAGDVAIGTGVGSGAALGPGEYPHAPGTLTIQSSLTLNVDATYKVTLNSSLSSAAAVVANGVQIINAQIVLNDVGSASISAGTVFTIITNTAATPISGTFTNLPDGGTIVVGSNTFQANYEGGDGNDLTLTVVP